jgi:hypothetical protein
MTERVIWDRVEVEQERCTVSWERVVGETGEWLGVEWDMEGRGKNDEEHVGGQALQLYEEGVGDSGRDCGGGCQGQVLGGGGGGQDCWIQQKENLELHADIGTKFVEVPGFDQMR